MRPQRNFLPLWEKVPFGSAQGRMRGSRAQQKAHFPLHLSSRKRREAALCGTHEHRSDQNMPDLATLADALRYAWVPVCCEGGWLMLIVGGRGADGSQVLNRSPASARPPFVFAPNSRLGMALSAGARIQERIR